MKEVKSPWISHIYMEKFDREQWNTAMLDMNVPDLCLELQNPAMPWYFLTSQMKKKNCPYPAGHVETFVNASLTEVPDRVPHSFIGRYRFFNDYAFIEGLKKVSECFFGGFELMEF